MSTAASACPRNVRYTSRLGGGGVAEAEAAAAVDGGPEEDGPRVAR